MASTSVIPPVFSLLIENNQRRSRNCSAVYSSQQRIRNNTIVAYLVVFAFVFSCSSNLVFSQECQGTDFSGLISECGQNVFKAGPKTPPSPACCDIIKKADVPCVCSKVTPEIEAIVDIQKVVYVAVFCGKAVPHGTKCGSVTIPSF